MPLTIVHAKNNTVADFTGTATVYNASGVSTTIAATDLIRPSDWNSVHNASFNMLGSEIASLFAFGTGLTSTTNSAGITVAGAFDFGRGLSTSSNASGMSVGLHSDVWWEPFPHLNTQGSQMSLFSGSIGTWYLDGPHELDDAVGSGQLNFFRAFPANFLGGAPYSAASTGSVTRTASLWDHVALYTRGTGANSTRLESLWTMQNTFIATNEMRLNTANTSSGSLSNYLTVSFPSQFDASGGVTYGSVTASGTSILSTSTMASTRYDSLITGAGQYLSGSIMMPFGLSTTLPPGIYWFGRMMNTSTSSAGTAGGIGSLGTYFANTSGASWLGEIENAGNAYKRLGSSASNSSTNFAPFHGYLATSTTNASANLATADVRGINSRAYFNYWQSSY